VDVNTTKPSALIVGGGIIGLASAFRLARSGHAVTLFDPSVARGATWAAAGMVAPSAEIAPGEQSNYQLQKQALQAWRDLSDELEAITGERLTISQPGTLLAGWDAGDRRLIEQFSLIAEQFDAPMQRVTRRESPEIFVGLSPRMNDGLVMADDAWLDPDEAVRLLRLALDELGVTVIAERVVRISADASHVVAHTEHGELRGDLGILATGSVPLPEGASPSGEHVVRPVRGVTVRVQGIDRSDQPMIRAFVRGRAFYMVSRPGGYCVLGATSEERAEPAVEVGELQRLLRDGLDVVPDLESAVILEMRNGLRPASADLLPFFEHLGIDGWAWSSGHYRHGVTLAPIAARTALEFAESPA